MGASLVPASLVHAQESNSEEQLFQVEDALNVQTQVASQRAMNVRETPGVVTIVSREEIQSSGARTLIDVLRRVPGFDVELDVDGVTSLGFRGIWGQEGKILLLLDGLEMNEPFYGTLQIWNRIPLDAIKSIEIIRGPGSALYGGHAELAVINVITQGPEQSGVAVSARDGQMTGGSGGFSAYGERNVTLTYGQSWPGLHDLGVSASLYLGEANRSDQVYQDLSGGRFPMLGNNTSRPMSANIGLSFQNLRARFIYDDYHTTTRDGNERVLLEAQRKDFVSTLADVSYEWKPTERLKITPLLSFRQSTPWNNNDPSSRVFYDLTADRYTARLTALYDVTDQISISAGGEGALDHVKANQPAANQFAPLGFQDYKNIALFSEAQLNTKLANVVLGARFEDHSQFGTSFVPRVALTKLIDRFNLKLLFSGAFRAPDLQDIADNPQIKPERTWVAEVEAGYKINDHIFVSANVFNIEVDGPIVYYRNSFSPSGNYFNASQTGSRGAEAELKANYAWGSADLSYSFYRSTNEVPDYSVPGHDGLALAFPAHKLSVSATVPIWKGLRLSPTAVFLSSRYGYTSLDDSGKPVIGSESPAALVNLFLSYQDLGVKNLQVGVGVFNLFDQRFRFVQAYASGHAPMPDASREFVLHISYKLDI